MSRCIDADKFIEDQRKFYCEDCYMRKSTSTGEIVYDIGSAACSSCRLNDALNALEDTPTADVEEVRHGKWELVEENTDQNGNNLYECSNCGKGDTHSPSIYVPRCWYCGSKNIEDTEEQWYERIKEKDNGYNK